MGSNILDFRDDHTSGQKCPEVDRSFISYAKEVGFLPDDSGGAIRTVGWGMTWAISIVGGC